MAKTDSFGQLLRSPAFKFVVVVVLILLLSVPLLFAYVMVKEREQYADAAQREIGQMWGGAQTVRGPYVIVPTITERTVQTRDETRTEKIRSLAVLLPEELTITPVVRTELRSRGIFSVPVYRSEIAFQGRFDPPELRKISQAVNEILWQEAVLAIVISDVRGIKRTAEIDLGEATASRFRAGLGIESDGLEASPHRNHSGSIHVPISEAQARQGFPFTFKLDLNGSDRLAFVPAGGETEVVARSDWPHPSFTGAFLPDTRTITDRGFEARWKIPRLARGHGQSLLTRQMQGLMEQTTFGVRFFQPVKFYSLVERALKYALGFIAIVFLAVFVTEIQSARRVHWIQYLFVGLALIVFYLILLGTAEHIGFEWGYLGAAAATALLVGGYIAAVTRSPPRGGVIAAVIALIYALLYLLLRVEDYAMLIGSIAAFVLLATVMFATRNVDWTRPSDGDGLGEETKVG